MISQEPLPSHDPDRAPQRGSVVNIASQLGIVGRPSARKFLSQTRLQPDPFSFPLFSRIL